MMFNQRGKKFTYATFALNGSHATVYKESNQLKFFFIIQFVLYNLSSWTFGKFFQLKC